MHNVENIEFTIITILKVTTWNFKKLWMKNAQTHTVPYIHYCKIKNHKKGLISKYFPNKIKSNIPRSEKKREIKHRKTQKVTITYCTVVLCECYYGMN